VLNWNRREERGCLDWLVGGRGDVRCDRRADIGHHAGSDQRQDPRYRAGAKRKEEKQPRAVAFGRTRFLAGARPSASRDLPDDHPFLQSAIPISTLENAH
jgi:hypothetical protein